MTDGGPVFRANQARAVYEAAGIAKHEIERGKPWQSYIETTFDIRRRMADWHFAKARSWPELVAVHDCFVEDCNASGTGPTATARTYAGRRPRFWAG